MLRITSQGRSIHYDLLAPVQNPTVVVSAYAPPELGGTPSVMYELLRHFPSESLVLITKRRSPKTPKDDRVLDVKTVEIGDAGYQIPNLTLQLLLLPIRVLYILICMRRLRISPGNVLAVYPDLDFLLAALVVSWLRQTPLHVYLHDCIVESTPGSINRLFARVAERLTFRLSAIVYSLSIPMARFYSELGYETDVLPHAVDTSLLRAHRYDSTHVPIRVGFAGAVYQTNDSAIQDLIAAKAQLGAALELRFVTPPTSRRYLQTLGALDSIDCAVTLGTHFEVLEFLSQCDVLFLPMSFASIFEKDLLTVFPTKVTDYWLAQRPILVYGPRKYAFVAMAERGGYAVTVSERSPERLAEAIKTLASSPPLANRLVAASREMVRRHDGLAIARSLMNNLGLLRE